LFRHAREHPVVIIEALSRNNVHFLLGYESKDEPSQLVRNQPPLLQTRGSAGYYTLLSLSVRQVSTVEWHREGVGR
jgi:hypothetical protein